MTPKDAEWLAREAPAVLLRWEGLLLSLLAWAGLLALPLVQGELGLSWDAVNHHIYLGWTAQQHRFDLDFLAAGYQSTQSPYLYWPAYKMATSGWAGVTAGVVIASLHALAVWPVWMMARACMPGRAIFDITMRALAVALAMSTGIVLSAVGTTMNDVLAALPLVWSVALALEAVVRTTPETPARRWIVLSGLLAGVSVALKLSNGPLAVLMPLLWLSAPGGPLRRFANVVSGCLAALAGAALGYGHWGWLLWRNYGNPVYPFYDHWFAPLRAALGWTG